MKILKVLSLSCVAALACMPVLAQDGDSPFSSPEEKRTILRIAGRDGMIERAEWEADMTRQGDLSDLTWEKLQSFDLDGDGTIGVNEFYRYIDRRMKSAAGPDPIGTARSTEDRTRLLAAVRAQGGDDEATVFDRRMLFQRAQFARRTKFQQRTDPEREEALRRLREERLQEITTERRLAAARNAIMNAQGEDPDRLRNLYRARLVKHRISKTGESEGRRQGLADSLRRSSRQNDDDANRRRQMLQDAQRSDSRVGTDPRRRYQSELDSSRGDRSSRDSLRSREASNIRELIPPSRSERQAPAKTEKRRAPTPKKSETPSAQDKNKSSFRR